MVWHHVDPISLSLVSYEEALVPPAIRPCVQPKASDFAIDPLSSEFPSICPSVSAKPIDLAFDPITFVLSIVFPLVPPEPILLPILVSSFEIFILPYLNSYATLCVLEPLALILATILMD